MVLHTDELIIDEALVRRLVDSQLPEYAGLTATRLPWARLAGVWEGAMRAGAGPASRTTCTGSTATCWREWVTGAGPSAATGRSRRRS